MLEPPRNMPNPSRHMPNPSPQPAPYECETHGIWLELPNAVRTAIEAHGASFARGGLHAAEHLLVRLLTHMRGKAGGQRKARECALGRRKAREGAAGAGCEGW